MLTVTYNNQSLNAGAYRVTSFDHETTANLETALYDLPRERGAVYVEGERGSKEIAVSGSVRADNRQGLDDAIDALKGMLSAPRKPLSVTYGLTLRTYRDAYCSSVKISRGGSDITHAKWSATFVAPEGIGVGDLVTSSYENITALNNTFTYNVQGNTHAIAFLTLSYDPVLSGNVQSVKLTVNNESITVGSVASPLGKPQVKFDFTAKKVTLGNAVTDYEGYFPRLLGGDNAVVVESTMLSGTPYYDVDITYYPSYL
jgi:hypothetical protein